MMQYGQHMNAIVAARKKQSIGEARQQSAAHALHHLRVKHGRLLQTRELQFNRGENSAPSPGLHCSYHVCAAPMSCKACGEKLSRYAMRRY